MLSCKKLHLTVDIENGSSTVDWCLVRYLTPIKDDDDAWAMLIQP